MVRSNATEVALRGRCVDAVEEDADLRLPPTEIRAKDVDLLVVAQLCRPEGLGPSPDAQLALAGDAQVAHPLRLAPWGDEIPLTLRGEQVHRRCSPRSARAAADPQLARSPHADTG